MTTMTEDGMVIVSLAIRFEHDVVLARQRARQIALQIGLEAQEQIRFATAVSELARNAYQYAEGGRVQFVVERDGEQSVLVARLSDSGPGIGNLEQILQGRYKSRTGMGLGIVGARRLTDRFAIESVPGQGTRVSVGKLLPNRPGGFGAAEAAAIGAMLAREEANSPFEELQRQNQELLTALDALRTSKADVDRLNVELAETNRGVVALYAELDGRAEQMYRLSELKTRFLSDMSHELRTPLTSVINLARLLLAHADGPLTDDQTRQVTLIRQSADALAEIVNDLLDIAKIEAGRVELRIDHCTVAELFAALRGMFRPLVTGERVMLTFEDPDPAITLQTDSQRVAQVLRNFVSNALKFTVDGTVRVRAARDDTFVRLSVADTGIGIAPEDQERVFEEFAQVDGPIQRRVRGTGLGLPLSRKLATLLGGRVTLESRLGEGSTFSLMIPVQLDGGRAHG
jgi:signal transduction histidine kinase